jgi:hypothetical protein
VTSEGPKVVDLEARGLEYRVRIVIDHPADDLAAFTQLTGLVPGICWTRGQERYVPEGTRLPGREFALEVAILRDFPPLARLLTWCSQGH